MTTTSVGFDHEMATFFVNVFEGGKSGFVARAGFHRIKRGRKTFNQVQGFFFAGRAVIVGAHETNLHLFEQNMFVDFVLGLFDLATTGSSLGGSHRRDTERADVVGLIDLVLVGRGGVETMSEQGGPYGKDDESSKLHDAFCWGRRVSYREFLQNKRLLQ
jgi:hypothetical protein